MGHMETPKMDQAPPSPTDADLVTESLATRIARVSAFVEGVRAADVDAVHDMRVASRRLRAALRVWGKAMAPEEVAPLAEAAREITQLLGRARELDVGIGLLVQEQKRATGPWAEALAVAKVALLELRAGETEACGRAAEIAAGWAAPEAMAQALVATWSGEIASLRQAQLDRGLHRLWKAHRRWQHKAHEEELHALRVAFKKYRYTCEVFAPQCAALGPLLAELKAAQEALGDWNDFRVVVAELARLGLDAPTRKAQALMVEALKHREAEYLAAFVLQAAVFFTDENRRRIQLLWSPLETTES